jgi:protein-tyrosine phosphatase
MRPVFFTVERIGSGLLAVMGRPRAGEWAADEFAGLAEQGITDIVSLLELSEARELGLADEHSHCASAGIRFKSFPIVDRGLPSSAADLSVLACDIYHRCASGAGTLIHCRAGIGRTGLVAAAVLLHCGFEPADAFATVGAARGVTVPDTAEQARWLATHAAVIRKCHLPQART